MTVHCSTTIASFPFLSEPGNPGSSSYINNPSNDLVPKSARERKKIVNNSHLENI